MEYIYDNLNTDDLPEKELNKRLKDKIQKTIGDPQWRMNNLYMIQTKHSKIENLSLNNVQHRIHNETSGFKRIMHLKARQMGVSTYWLIRELDDVMWNPHTTCAVLAHDMDTIHVLFEIIQRAYDNIPERIDLGYGYVWQKPVTDRKTIRMIRFPELDSKIYVDLEVRGGTIHLLHISEAAFVKDMGSVWAATQESVPPHGRIVVESCVTGDTLIPTSSGLRPILSMVPQPQKSGHQEVHHTVVSRGGHKTATSAFVNGKAETRRLETRSGFSVEATMNHPLLTLSEGELRWKRVEAIERGELLCISYGKGGFGDDAVDFVPTARRGTKGNTDRFSISEVDAECGYLLGLYLAEGYASKKPVRTVITSGDEKIHDWLSSWGFVKKDAFHSHWFRRDFVDFMEHLGLQTERRAWEKEIPDRFLTFSQKTQRAILQGMFDGDGSIHANRRMVNYSTTSEAMARRLQIMLLPFGVVAKLNKKPPVKGGVIDGRRINGVHNVFVLEIDGCFYEAFMENIGFRLRRKQEKFLRGESRGISIPGMWKKLKEVCTGYGNLVAMFRKANMPVGPDGQCNACRKAMSLPYLARFIKAGADIDPETMDYFYDPVVSIEKGEAETFDLTVPETESFVGNGIMCHNTACGKGNWFHEQWENGQGWKKLFFPWYDLETNRVNFSDKGPMHEFSIKTVQRTLSEEENKLMKEFDLDWEQMAWYRYKMSGYTEGEKYIMKQENPMTAEEAFVFAEGRFYPEFSRSIHVVNEHKPPKGVNTFAALDYGWSNPTAIGLWYVDYDGNCIMYDELYGKNIAVKDQCAWLKKQGFSRVRFADPSIFHMTQQKAGRIESIADEYRRYGIIISPANNDKGAGFERMRDYLRLRTKHKNPITGELNAPTVYIGVNCTETIREFESIRYAKAPKSGINQENREDHEKTPDLSHAVDMVRYFIISRPPIPKFDENVPYNTPLWRLKEMSRRRERSGVTY